MKRILWLVIVTLLLTPQSGALGSSTLLSTKTNFPVGREEPDILQSIRSIYSPDTNGQNVLDAYPIHSGYPLDLDRWIDKAPVTIADINGDGNNEMLVPTYNEGAQYPGKLYAWDKDGALLAGFPISTNGHLQGRIALGDLDHNGDLEIVASVDSFNIGIGPTIYIWRPNGTLYPGWPQNTDCFRADEYCSVASISLADYG